MYCPNRACPDFQESGEPGEYRDEIRVCPKCGARLVAEPPPELRRATAAAGEADEAPSGALVAVASFHYRQDADLAAAFLQANGVAAVVFGHYSGSTDPRIGFGSRVRVMAPESQVRLATALLEEAPRSPGDGSSTA